MLKKLTGSRNFGLLLGFAVLLIVAWFITPQLFSYYTIIEMLRNNAVFGLLAIGEMFVILTGGIDISIGSTLAFAGVVCTRFMSENMEAAKAAGGDPLPAILWVLVGILVGLLCGAFNGLIIGYLKMVPMIATLGTMYIYRGFAFLVSEGQWWFPHQFTDGYKNVALFRPFLNIPLILLIVVLVFILAAVFLGYTTMGRRIYAIGTNKESSKVAGINESRVTFMAFTICGALAGLCGMLYTANYVACSYDIGQSYEMTAIAICILGGVSINGGRGRVDGVTIALLMMSVIAQFISMLPGLSVWQDAIKGAIIIVAVGINILTSRAESRRVLKERGALI